MNMVYVFPDMFFCSCDLKASCAILLIAEQNKFQRKGLHIYFFRLEYFKQIDIFLFFSDFEVFGQTTCNNYMAQKWLS